MSDVSEENFSTTFHLSRWFSRGWTLQELLAPNWVSFFDREWTLLGHKKGDLVSAISEVTRIEKEVLCDPNKIQKQSIACRMSWASRRTCTRIEDVAYSLMGLFVRYPCIIRYGANSSHQQDVNMPLLYGEKNRAFGRLQDEILKAGVDHSLLAWGLAPLSWDLSEQIGYGVNVDLLAQSPKDFDNCGNIVAGDSLQPGPYMMTNEGLQITFFILETQFKSLGLLDCHLKGSKDCLVAISLEKHPGHGYSRRTISSNWCSGFVHFDEVVHATIENTTVKRKGDNQFSSSSSSKEFHDHVTIVRTEAVKSLFNGPMFVLPNKRDWSYERQCLRFPWESSCAILLLSGSEYEDGQIFVFVYNEPIPSRGLGIKIVEASSNTKLKPPWDGSLDEWIAWADSQSPGLPEDLNNQNSVNLVLSCKNKKKMFRANLIERSIFNHEFLELKLDVVDEECEDIQANLQSDQMLD